MLLFYCLFNYLFNCFFLLPFPSSNHPPPPPSFAQDKELKVFRESLKGELRELKGAEEGGKEAARQRKERKLLEQAEKVWGAGGEEGGFLGKLTFEGGLRGGGGLGG